MTDEPAVRRRIIGSALRRYREAQGYTLGEAASVLGCDPSKISRVENGRRGIRPRELRDLLTEYGVPAQDQRALALLTAGPGHLGWRDLVPPDVPEPEQDLLIIETAAADLMIYDPQLIPGLLQVPGYTQAVAGARPGTGTGPQPGEQAAALAARQRQVLTSATQLTVVIGEAALRHDTGHPGVMAEQIRHLLELPAGHPQVTIQVLPFTAGAHPAMRSGAHAICRFTPAIAVVQLSALTGALYLDSPADIALYTTAFTQLRSRALPPESTMRLLQQLLGGRPSPQ